MKRVGGRKRLNKLRKVIRPYSEIKFDYERIVQGINKKCISLFWTRNVFPSGERLNSMSCNEVNVNAVIIS